MQMTQTVLGGLVNLSIEQSLVTMNVILEICGLRFNVFLRRNKSYLEVRQF
jgi:hypothetical protein